MSDAAYPDDFRQEHIKATETHHWLIDDFEGGFDDWYALQQNNRNHWFFTTRKLADPRWAGPCDWRLVLDVATTEPNNTLGMQIETDARGYAGRRRVTYTAVVTLVKTGSQSVELKAGNFVAEYGTPLSDWDSITELAFRSAVKARPTDKSLRQRKGDVPTFANLRCEVGEIIVRPKLYPNAAAVAPSANGLVDPEFQRAIERSLKQ